MSPLDDSLRAALAGRAAGLAPAPDPLAGVQARAAQIRRRRTAGAMAGTALAVALVAVGVPAALGGAPPSSGPSGFATPTGAPPASPTSPPPASPTSPPAPTAVQPTPGPRFDPGRPWDYRGDARLLQPRNLDAVTRAWQDLHPGSAVVPLFGQLYEPSAQLELLFVGRTGNQVRWGVARYTETGPELAVDQPIRAEQAAFVAALPGDEAGRLLAVAAPTSSRFGYSPDGTTELPMTTLTDGVATHPLEGDRARDSVRVYAADGSRVYLAPAPDVDPVPSAPTAQTTSPVRVTRTPSSPPSPSPTATAAATATATAGPSSSPTAPGNLLDWLQRGDLSVAPSLEQARQAYATAIGRPDQADTVQFRVLFTARFDGGSRGLYAQAWLPGQPARPFGYTVHAAGEPEIQVGPTIDAGAEVLAFLVADLPGASTDTLVVVPAPRTGQVYYGANDATEYEPVTGQDHLDGVVLVDRQEDATTDQLKLLDGNGDLDKPTFQGPVAGLLCGLGGCG